MKHRIKLTLATLICLLFYVSPVAAVDAADPLTLYGVVMLQQDKVLKQRVSDAQALADYEAALQAAISIAVAKDQRHAPKSGYIVVALKPGGKSNAWLDFDPPLTPVLGTEVVAAVRSVQPLQVQGGIVAFGLKVGFWGGPTPAAPAPSPEEWKIAVKKIGHPVKLEELIQAIWPE